MITFFAILFALALGFAIFLLIKNKRLEADVLRTKNEAQSSVTEAQNSAYQKIAALQQESQTAVAEAQKLIDQQFAEMQQESERVRQHYEAESRKNQETADALVSKTVKDFEPLRKYEKLRDAEVEAQRQLTEIVTLFQPIAYSTTSQKNLVMTRRGKHSNPRVNNPERVDDLYNASVPFEFDIHAVIKTKNAAAFEYKFHRQFLPNRWNKKNLQKEFFRVSLEEIHQEVEKLKQKGEDCELKWVETEAGRVAEWQESRDIENDSQRKARWLQNEQASADERWHIRERRLARRGTDASILSVSDALETDAGGAVA